MILERITSALRERRILRLARRAIRAARSGDKLGSRVDFLRMSREIERRTPQQIERMERAQRLVPEVCVVSRRKAEGVEDASQDVMLPAGEAQRQVGLMQALYRPTPGVGQCQPCRGVGRISIRGGAQQTCPKCKGRGRGA